MRKVFTFIAFCLSLLTFGQTDSLVVSLITCGEGDGVHEYYGHTALRVRRVGGEPFDYIFNYGAFDFNKPDFVWLFIKGETDYTVSMEPMKVFAEYYDKQRHIRADEQVLNLTQNEAHRLAGLLYSNAVEAIRTQWTYRYNFFYDNCTTHALDMLSAAFEPGTELVWPEPKERTLRQILHESSCKHPFTMIGEDMLLGADVDGNATLRDQLFSPFYASEYIKSVKVKRADGSETLLAQSPTNLWPDTRETSNESTVYYIVVVLLGALLFTLIIYEKIKKKYFYGIDLTYFSLQTLLGTVVATMFFCSVHPSVDSNWLILWLNPLYIIALGVLIRQIWKKSITMRFRHVMACVSLVTLLVFCLCPQSIPTEILILIALYGIHSGIK